MPLWLSAAVLVSLLYASINILDKLIMTRFINSPIVYVLLEVSIGLVPAALLIIGGYFHSYSNEEVALGLLTGAMLTGFSFLYTASLRFGDVTAIAMILQMAVVVNIGIGVWFFAERYTFGAFVGMGLIVVAAVVATRETSDRERCKGDVRKPGSQLSIKLLALMIPAIFIGAASFALQKYVGRSVDLSTLFALGRIGAFVAAVPVLISQSSRTDIAAFSSAQVNHGPIKAVLVITAVQALNIVATFLSLVAYVTGPVALVATAGAMQPLFVLLLILVIRKLLPTGGLGASQRPREWFIRLVLALLVLIGSFLIYTQ